MKATGARPFACALTEAIENLGRSNIWIGVMHDRRNAAQDAARKIARFKRRRDDVANNSIRKCVGQLTFETLPDFNAHAALVRSDDQENAVVGFCAAEFPLVCRRNRGLFDRQAAKACECQNRDLRTSGVANFSQTLLNHIASRFIDDAGVVDDRTR